MPSWSYRNLFEWLLGSGSGPDMSASGSMVLSGAAQLQTIQVFDAVGSFVMSGESAMTTDITMEAAGSMVLTGAADLQAAKTGGRLANCGHVLAADCDQWLLDPFL